MESACETCSYFRTSVEFLPILTRQRDHAAERGQTDRAALFDGLIQRAETRPSHRTELTMADARNEFTDAVELAELLELIARWLSADQRQTLADSFAAFIGPHTTYRTDDLIADPHRFAFLLGVSDGEQLFGEPTP
jgi:hypothetical protein